MAKDTGRSQCARLLALLRDRKWHNTVEIMRKVYGKDHSGICRVGARIWDLKRLGYEIKSKVWNETGTVWAYKLIGKPMELKKCWCGDKSCEGSGFDFLVERKKKK